MPQHIQLNELITQQENQIKVFQRQRADMWAAVQATEKEILQQHNCTYNTAPPNVLHIIAKLREDYDRYWSHDGVLLTELMRRQTMARQKLIDDMNR
jgi:hypothetical protein